MRKWGPGAGYGRWGSRADQFYVRFNGYKLTPYLHIPGRAAWWLAWRASRKGLSVADLISEVVTFWADQRIAEMGRTDFADFSESIPYSRPELRKPHGRSE